MTIRLDRAQAARRAALSALPLSLIGVAVRAAYPRVEPELAALGDIAPRGGTAVDVGAWFGPWARRLTRYADSVVAVEAHPELAALLRRSLPGVRVVQAAASDSPGEIDLHVPAAGPAVGVSSVEGAEGRTVTVPRVTLDGLELRDVRFIKMDIEGHELAALRGAARLIARDRPLLLIELEERLGPVAPVVDLLATWGYAGWVRPGGEWLPLADFDLAAHQREAIGRVRQSLPRRVVWPHPRYVNMVLFRG